MMQTPLPLPTSCRWKAHPAHGGLLDYDNLTLRPVSPRILADCLRRIHRFGVHQPFDPRAQVNVLLHSMGVAMLVQEVIAPLTEYSETTKRAAVLYAALHDVGEIMGGDLPSMVSPEAAAPLRAMQSRLRDQIVTDLGLPLLGDSTSSRQIQGMIAAGDLLAVPLEKTMAGISSTVRAAFEEMEVLLHGWTTLQARLHGVAPGPLTGDGLALAERVYSTYVTWMTGWRRRGFLGQASVYRRLLAVPQTTLFSDAKGCLQGVLFTPPSMTATEFSGRCHDHARHGAVAMVSPASFGRRPTLPIHDLPGRSATEIPCVS